MGPEVPYSLLRTREGCGVGLSWHLERLGVAARFYGMAFDERETRRAVAAASEGLGLTDLVVVVALVGGEVWSLARESAVPALESKRVVTVDFGPRANPAIKTSSWCFDRRPLEKKAFDEVLLTDADGNLLEGLTHNVAVVDDEGTLYAADDSFVLPGVAMRHALDAARRSGLHHQRRAPRLKDASSWRHVFITNANALCQPVSEISNGETGDLLFRATADNDDPIKLIRDTMLDDIHTSSSSSSWCEPLLL